MPIVCSLDRFRVYLIGVEFVIKTDCNNLKLLAEKRDLSPRIGRWFLKLSEYNYKIEYVKGSEHRVPEALSRNPTEEADEPEVANLQIFGIKINTDWVAALQRSSVEVVTILEKLSAKEAGVCDKYAVDNGRFYRVKGGRWRLYLPEDLRFDVVSEAHRELTHLGVDKTMSKVKENYYFPKMRDFISKYINRCINCLYYKTPKKGQLYWHPLEKGTRVMHTVHLDHLGPFTLTERDKKYIMVMIDGFSKYVFMRAVQDVTARETVIVFREFISHYGKPERVITNRGTAFTAAMFTLFCREHNIMHVKVASKSPRSNGQVEIVNAIVLRCLATSTDDIECTDWDLTLMEVQWAINNSVHRITKCKPFEVMHKYRAEGLVNDPLAKEIEELNERMGNSTNDYPTENLNKHRTRECKTISERKKRPEKFSNGDLVLVKREAPATGQSRKLEPKYKGPYIISRELRYDRYVVTDIPGEQQGGKRFSSVVGFDRLKGVTN